jgi:hypothetical protein
MTPLAQLQHQWPAISELLDEALALPAAVRTEWLASLRGARAEHRQVLADLLATQAGVETDDFLAELPQLPGFSSDEPARPAEHSAAGRLEAGGLVGPYRLIEQIGCGGMATVWLADRADGLVSRRVALKLPHSVWGDSFAERLARERDILATLSHEHIARLYDVGIDSHGRPYLAMEFVEGEAIDAYCRTHQLPLRERIALLLQVMSAVAHAHARLVVHRDLKPSNILVTKEGQVRLLDFGIAKLLDGERTRETALTELGGRALTLDYASPEQIRGEPLGTASDVYSMAVVAYELLAEARPYRLKRGSAAELEEAIAAAEPLLASDAATSKSLRRELRGDLDAILNRGLKKLIVDRYPSIETFAQDVERYLRGEPVQARPDSAGYRAGKFVRRHELAVAMTATLALSVVAGGGLSLWQAHVARNQERLAMSESDRQIAVSELYMETMSRLAVLAKDEPAELSKPHAVTALLRQQLQDRMARFANRPAQLEAQMKAVMLQLNFGNEFEASLAVGKDYLAHLKAHDAPPPEVIHAYSTLGRTLYQLHRFEECEAMRRAAVAWAPDVNDEFTELSRLSAAVDLANILRSRGKRTEAFNVLTRNEALAAQRFPNNMLRFENQRYLALFWLGFDDARALQAMRQAHAGMLAAGTADDDLRSAYLRYLGDALVANGRSAEAETALRASADLNAHNYGRTSANAVSAVGRLANAIAAQGDIARAQRLLVETLHEVASESGGSAPAQARELRRRRLDIAWLAGDAPSVDWLSPDEVSAFTAPAKIRANEQLLLAQARLWTLTGRSRDALAVLTSLRKTWPEPGQLTAGWVELLLQQAGAELTAADPVAAQATARELLALLEQNDARSGRPFRVAEEIAALAAARLGDRPAAAQALAQADATKPAFPSRVEAADSALRRGEVQAALGRTAQAAALGGAALADLVGQHLEDTRLQQAQRLAALHL